MVFLIAEHQRQRRGRQKGSGGDKRSASTPTARLDSGALGPRSLCVTKQLQRQSRWCLRVSSLLLSSSSSLSERVMIAVMVVMDSWTLDDGAEAPDDYCLDVPGRSLPLLSTAAQPSSSRSSLLTAPNGRAAAAEAAGCGAAKWASQRAG